MTNGLTLLEQSMQPWEPIVYPAVAGASWRTSFEKASEAVRQNIANCWLYCFNQECENQTETFLLKAVVKNALFIRDIKPYLSAAPQTVLNFDGSFQSCLAECGCSYTQDVLEKDIDNVNMLWFSTGTKRTVALEKIVAILHTINADGYAIDSSILELVYTLAWSVVDAEPDNATPLRLAVMLGLVSALSRDNVGLGTQTAKSHCWRALLYYAGTGGHQNPRGTSSNPVDTHVDWIAQVQSYPVDVALPLFITIILECCECSNKETNNAEVLMAWSPFRTEEMDQNAGIYTVLTEWFPQYKNEWDTAELLDISVLQAYEGLVIDAPVERACTEISLPITLVL